MKKKLVLPFLFFYAINFAQEKLPYIDFDDITKQVGVSSKSGDFNKTLEILNKINKNDSTYCSILVSKSYYLTSLKKYDEAIKMADNGLQKKCWDTHRAFFLNKSLALMNQKKYAKAIEVLDEGLKRFPKNSSLWYNKGVSLEYSGKIQEAIEVYQTTIELNPFYRKPYLQLGNICYKQELISQALMCYNMYLLIEPDADNAFNTLKSLNNLVKNKNVNTRNTDLRISVDDEAFEDIDLVLSNQIALNKNYNTGNDINIALIKQNHALLQQLQDFSGNGGFWDTKFVPFYKWIQDSGSFNIFSYTISYSIENENYKKIITKNVKDITDFIDLYKSKWTKIIQNKKMLWHGNQSDITFKYNNGYVEAMGKTENERTVGEWEYYNSVGRLTVNGNFNASGNRDGKWTWFNQFGKISETAGYVDGKLKGEVLRYYENGKLEIDANYKDGNLDGEYRYYNNRGALTQKKYFEDGKLNGLYMSYFKVGEKLPEFNIQYENGEVKDKAIEYYSNGNIYSEMSFSDGNQHGPENKYYLNGKLSSEINYVNGELNGSYNTFHSNGNPMEVGQTLNGFYDGHWKSYYDDGILEIEYEYNRGELNGIYKYYDSDEKLHYEYEYRKDEIIAFKFFDKLGNIIKEGRKKGGEFYYTGFSPQGNITSEGLYDLKGGKEGVWKFYSTNGILTEQGEYRDNKVQGDNKTYYKNGNIKAITPYKNGVLSGYYVEYHKNGKMSSQGWYKNNNQHGEWRFYAIDGTLNTINFLHKGLLQGKQQYFSGAGKPSQTTEYLFGELMTDTYFDKNGKVFEQMNFDIGKSNYEIQYRHFNKKPSTKISYVNGIKHGPYTYFDYYGRKITSGEYLNGEQHGKWTWYHDNGAIARTSTYVAGQLHGEYLSFYDTGQPKSKYYYNYGSSEKTDIFYHQNGNIYTSTPFKNDNPHGRKESYSLSGKFQLVRFYDHGRLIGFSYLNKDSKELPMIPLKKESGKIRAYYDNGKVSREFEYKYGDLIGLYKEFYYTGQIAHETPYKQGEYHGTTKEYFSNGKLKKQKDYSLGSLHGKVTEFYENGTVKKEESYSNGIKDGVFKTYDKNGKIINEEIYFNDDIVESKTD